MAPSAGPIRSLPMGSLNLPVLPVTGKENLSVCKVKHNPTCICSSTVAVRDRSRSPSFDPQRQWPSCQVPPGPMRPKIVHWQVCPAKSTPPQSTRMLPERSPARGSGCCAFDTPPSPSFLLRLSIAGQKSESKQNTDSRKIEQRAERWEKG